MSKAIIFAGANGPDDIPDDLMDSDSFVCAADSGFDLAVKLGFSVDFVIGDFDSTQLSQDIKSLPHTKLECDKADSDTEQALKTALCHGCTHWVLVGGGEGRYDHLFSLLTLFSRYTPPEAWYTRCETLYLVREKGCFSSILIGTTVGIVPAFPSGRSRVTTQGLHWDVTDYCIDATQISLSNRTDQRVIQIEVEGDPVFFSVIAV